MKIHDTPTDPKTLVALAVDSTTALQSSSAFRELKRRVVVVSFANTSMYGRAIPIAPRASATDGHLDCCLIDPVGMLRVATLLPRILLGRHENQRVVHFLRLERIMLRADRPLEIWADGEPIGTTPATVEAVAAEIRVITSP